jgi:hypothetical protein
MRSERAGPYVPLSLFPLKQLKTRFLGQIRQAQRGTLALSAWEQMDREGQVEAIQAIIERVGYDGVGRQISIQFGVTDEEGSA